jgi:hypothetical protein
MIRLTKPKDIELMTEHLKPDKMPKPDEAGTLLQTALLTLALLADHALRARLSPRRSRTPLDKVLMEAIARGSNNPQSTNCHLLELVSHWSSILDNCSSQMREKISRSLLLPETATLLKTGLKHKGRTPRKTNNEH